MKNNPEVKKMCSRWLMWPLWEGDFCTNIILPGDYCEWPQEIMESEEDQLKKE